MQYLKKTLITFSLFFLTHVVLMGENWQKLAKVDSKSVYTILKDNHPGSLSNDNHFKYWLEKGYQETLHKAQNADSYEKYLFLLYEYISGFEDLHINIWPDAKFKKETVQWPGFLVQFNEPENYFFVSLISHDREKFPHLPPLGAKVIKVDTYQPKEFLEKFSFPYWGGIKNLAASYGQFADDLVIYRDNPYVPQASSLTFDDHGIISTIELTWHTLSKNTLNETLNKEKKLPSIEASLFKNDSALWVSIPTFDPSSEEEIKELHTVIDKVKSAKNLSSVVFDVRGNTGGNGNWGALILKALLGDEYFESINSQFESPEYWRPSEENIEYLENYTLPHLEKSFGTDDINYQGTKNLVKKLKKNKNKKKLISGAPKASHRTPQRKMPHHPRIYVITDNNCFSACLNFLDLLKAIHNTVFLGRSTNADTRYSSSRTTKLPSNILNLQFPMSFEKKRKRKDNQPYTPDYQFPGDIYDTPSLKIWVADLIEKQENRKK